MHRYLWIALLGMAACGDKSEGEEGGDPQPDDSGEPQVTDADQDGSGADVDCDDADPAIYPGADEVCDEVDNDCDGDTDEDAIDVLTGYADEDGDSYGVESGALTACSLPTGYATEAGDCDDTNASVNPGIESDSCDGKDNDCDGGTDEDAEYTTIYPDTDLDGYGLDSGESQFCGDVPAGFVGQGGDCDDENAEINPDKKEVCDGADNDCDGTADGDGAIGADDYYADGDGDGYGESGATPVSACDAPAGMVDNAQDCDDADAGVNPGASEVCSDGIDNNCIAGIDEDLREWHTDADGDGFGDSASAPVESCSSVAGSADNALDCDDADASVNPKASEVCGDSLDNDCDGAADENLFTLYPDSDADGYGDGSVAPTESCTPVPGYSKNGDDCDDADSAISPKAAEVCDDGIDQDCSGAADDLCFESWTGFETLDYAVAVAAAGDRNCELYFDAAGTPSAALCPSCDFVFDVTYTYDAAASFDDGTCTGLSDAAGNLWTSTRTYTYGYESDYFGAGMGGAVLLNYYGSWSYWFAGDLDLVTSTLTYTYGYEDYGYFGYYYTYYQYGMAKLK